MSYIWRCRELVVLLHVGVIKEDANMMNVSSRQVIHQIDHTCHRNCYRYPGIWIRRSFLSLLLSTCPVDQLFEKLQASLTPFPDSQVGPSVPCYKSTGIWKKFGSEYPTSDLRYPKSRWFFSQPPCSHRPTYVALHPSARTCAEARQFFFSPRPLPLSLRFR